MQFFSFFLSFSDPVLQKTVMDMAHRNTTHSAREEELLLPGRRRTTSIYKLFRKMTPDLQGFLHRHRHDDNSQPVADTIDDGWGWVVAVAAFMIWVRQNGLSSWFGNTY